MIRITNEDEESDSKKCQVQCNQNAILTLPEYYKMVTQKLIIY